MAALSLATQTLAWKERVVKEVRNCNRNSFRAPVIPMTLKRFRRMQKKHQSSSPVEEKPKEALPDLRRVSLKPVSDSKIVSRPTTQGSLMKSKLAQPFVKKKAQSLNEEETEIETRPLPKEDAKVKPKQDFLKTTEIVFKENSEKDEDEDIKDEIEDVVHELPEQASSERSFKTTSSQRRYIERLEEMLKEEREKRNQLEKDVEMLKEMILTKT